MEYIDRHISVKRTHVYEMILFAAIVLTAIAVIPMSLVGAAEDSDAVNTFTVGDITYLITSNSTVKVKEVSKFASGDLTIPSSVIDGNKTYNVTSIGSNAFFQIGGLRTVTIPDSVKEISCNAFYDTKVTIKMESVNPDGIKISKMSFYRVAGIEVPLSALQKYQTSKSWSYYSAKIHAL